MSNLEELEGYIRLYNNKTGKGLKPYEWTGKFCEALGVTENTLKGYYERLVDSNKIEWRNGVLWTRK